ncbi:hypothetical protein MFMK1_002431 [Metallumcola ferriviriculae]|uniref:Uncharacterized protein n=1 Tax=Metallumcola ferriviriculae TaxID=3039180 RepID=A0AAU0URX8_9FIRM|nr:hypothetical protein MFMK1_002431 [Desulfitibacteraceae bacterium MK1]
MSFEKWEKYLNEKTGFPVRDKYDLPSSDKRFEGGAHARIEISGIENPASLEAMVDEAEKRNITVHRVISLVKGATLLDNQELKYFAQIGADNNLELLVNPVVSRGWDNGRQFSTPEGYVSGMRLRGHDMLNNYLREIERCIECGVRGFLVTDEGALTILNGLREDGIIPKDVKFKVSVFAGHGTAAGGKLLQNLGADSFNPLADLTLPMLASIRQGGVDVPLDVYMSLVESMGGFQRYHEAAEIARIAAPVYFKIEPGKSEADLYNTYVDAQNPEYGPNLARTRIKLAQIILEWVERSGQDIVMNDYKDDLSIPRP